MFHWFSLNPVKHDVSVHMPESQDVSKCCWLIYLFTVSENMTRCGWSKVSHMSRPRSSCLLMSYVDTGQPKISAVLWK